MVDTKKRSHILWACICIPARTHDHPGKIDLKIGDRSFEISIVADAFSKFSSAGDFKSRGYNQQSKQSLALKSMQSRNLNFKSDDDIRVGPNENFEFGPNEGKGRVQT